MAAIQLGASSTFQRLPKLFIAVFTVAILVGVAGLCVADLWWVRSRTLTKAEARAGNLASVISEYFRQTFAAGDAALRQFVIHGKTRWWNERIRRGMGTASRPRHGCADRDRFDLRDGRRGSHPV